MNNKKKVIFVGGPCSGKTTLCKELSRKYETVFVNEILMKYMIDNHLGSKDVTSNVILHCMKLQANQENENLKKSGSIQFCEGTSFSGISTLYSKELDEIIQLQMKDCNQIFLCDNNIPYIKSKVRPNYDAALGCHQAIVDYLQKNNLNYILLSGSLEERIKVVDSFIQDNYNI